MTALIFLLVIALLIIGCARFSTGLLTKEYLTWFRALLVIIGIISIVISVVLLYIPRFEIQFMLILVSFSFLLNGFVRLILGIIGTE